MWGIVFPSPVKIQFDDVCWHGEGQGWGKAMKNEE